MVGGSRIPTFHNLMKSLLRLVPTCSFLVAGLHAASNASTAAERFQPNYDESKVPHYVLPDPLTCTDGSRVTGPDMWRSKRRPELLELFAREVYGRTPAGRPKAMHWEVTSLDRDALDGKAVRKEITLWFTERKDGPNMRLLVYQPKSASAQAPVPAFLGLNFSGNQSVTADLGISISPRLRKIADETREAKVKANEPRRGSGAAKWEVEKVVARGYATATIFYQELCIDRAEGLASDVGGLFGTGPAEERRPDTWGAVGIWAWGLSRALDYLQADPEIDGKRVAVHGHSRLGKAALWAGAQDERFALVISNNSGCGGAALSMRIYGETVARISSKYHYWFAQNFGRYSERESMLPVDQHELIALIAPRPVYVASAQEDRWADPKGEFLGAKHADPVYTLFGKKGLGVSEMPTVNLPVFGDGLAYHVRTGKHDVTPYDWAQYLDFADRVLAPTIQKKPRMDANGR